MNEGSLISRNGKEKERERERERERENCTSERFCTNCIALRMLKLSHCVEENRLRFRVYFAKY